MLIGFPGLVRIYSGINQFGCLDYNSTPVIGAGDSWLFVFTTYHLARASLGLPRLRVNPITYIIVQ
jgi:hypothetical protein